MNKSIQSNPRTHLIRPRTEVGLSKRIYAHSKERAVVGLIQHCFTFLIIIGLSLPLDVGAQAFEVDQPENGEIAKFNGRFSSYIGIYKDGALRGQIGDNHGFGGLTLSAPKSGDQVNLVTNGFINLTAASNGNVGIGTRLPSAELEVNGYTKLGSGDAHPKIKIIKLELVTEGPENYLFHGLANGWKILDVNIRGAKYLVDKDKWVYRKFEVIHWDDNGIHFTMTPWSEAGIFIKIMITYEDQGTGVD